MTRRRLVLGDLNLRGGEKAERPDKAEEIANRIIEAFDLEVDDEQFDVMCDVIENTALNKHGDIKDHRSLAGVCAEVAQAKVPDDIRTALLLVLLKNRFKEMRETMHEVASRDALTEEVDQAKK
jgi:hypothetical protein